jgi:hypothetical protein
VADRVDLVRRHVELVVAPVLEQEVVALDAADGPRDHAAVASHAVLEVHDVVAGPEIVEVALGGGLAGFGPSVGPTPTGDVRLGEDRQADRREHEPPLEPCDGHVPARPGQVCGAPLVELEGDPLLAEQRDEAGPRAGTVGGDNEAVALVEELPQLAHQAFAVPDHGAPPRSGDGGHLGTVGRRRHGPGRRAGADEEAVEGHVQPREARATL